MCDWLFPQKARAIIPFVYRLIASQDSYFHTFKPVEDTSTTMEFLVGKTEKRVSYEIVKRPFLLSPVGHIRVRGGGVLCEKAITR